MTLIAAPQQSTRQQKAAGPTCAYHTAHGLQSLTKMCMRVLLLPCSRKIPSKSQIPVKSKVSGSMKLNRATAAHRGPSTLWTKLSMPQDTQWGNLHSSALAHPSPTSPAPCTQHRPLLTQPAITAGLHAPNPHAASAKWHSSNKDSVT